MLPLIGTNSHLLLRRPLKSREVEAEQDIEPDDDDEGDADDEEVLLRRGARLLRSGVDVDAATAASSSNSRASSSMSSELLAARNSWRFSWK